jgi:hypothetical protein
MLKRWIVLVLSDYLCVFSLSQQLVEVSSSLFSGCFKVEGHLAHGQEALLAEEDRRMETVNLMVYAESSQHLNGNVKQRKKPLLVYTYVLKMIIDTVLKGCRRSS